ncbi:hypothetical protein [Natrarchaeobius chitinivorans]|nr:hypothetical protein [Natrarchaeobius chitinivorans]
MSADFVRASRLYDVGSRTALVHPAAQANDSDVRRALEDHESRA